VDDRIRALLDKEEVAAAVNELFVATDERDWDRVEACFTPRVLFDITSMGAEEAETIDAAEIVRLWRTGLTPIRAVHHQIGNMRIALDEGEADVFCYGTAYHYLPDAKGGATRTFVGTYDLHLARDDRWRVDRFRFNLKFIDGNENLEQGL